MTKSLTFEGDDVKCTIPGPLYRAIIRIQATEGSDWSAACVKAASLVDSGGKKFEERLQEELRKRLNSELLTRVNKARSTIRAEAYNEARSQLELWYYCSICGVRITLTPNSESHKAIISYMAERGWGHKGCHENRTSQLG